MVDRQVRILLVDDELPIQTLLSYPLEKDGYAVVCASDDSAIGLPASTTISRNAPDG